MHLSADELEKYLRGEGESPFTRKVIKHLSQGCEECGQALARFLPSGDKAPEPATPPPSLDDALDRARQAYVRHWEEEQLADGLYRELEGHPPGRQITVIRSVKRFQVAPLVRRFIEACRENLSNDISRAVSLAELAVVTAESLDEERYGAQLGADLVCNALAELGNAQRRRSWFREAAATFKEAMELLEEGTGDPLTRARVIECRAFLSYDRGRHAEALKDLDAALRLYRSIEDLHRCGTTMVRQAQVLEDQGTPEMAIPLLLRAAVLVDTEYEPRWALAIYHNLVLCHTSAGRTSEALAYLRDAEEFYRKLGKPTDLLRLRWTEGKIWLEEGEVEAAEGCFREAAQGFASMGLAYEAAEVSLELSLAYLEQGKVLRLQQVAAELFPIFKALDLHREALAALMFLRRSVEAQTVTVEMIQRVSGFLEEIREDPSRTFERDGG